MLFFSYITKIRPTHLVSLGNRSEKIGNVAIKSFLHFRAKIGQTYVLPPFRILSKILKVLKGRFFGRGGVRVTISKHMSIHSLM